MLASERTSLKGNARSLSEELGPTDLFQGSFCFPPPVPGAQQQVKLSGHGFFLTGQAGFLVLQVSFKDLCCWSFILNLPRYELFKYRLSLPMYFLFLSLQLYRILFFCLTRAHALVTGPLAFSNLICDLL